MNSKMSRIKGSSERASPVNMASSSFNIPSNSKSLITRRTRCVGEDRKRLRTRARSVVGSTAPIACRNCTIFLLDMSHHSPQWVWARRDCIGDDQRRKFRRGVVGRSEAGRRLLISAIHVAKESRTNICNRRSVRHARKVAGRGD